MFRDDFTNSTGSTQYLPARSGWIRVAGAGADLDANVQAGATALKAFPVSGQTAFLCTDQAAADHYVEAAMLGACSSFVVLRATDIDNWVGFRLNDSGDFQVFKNTTAGGIVQLGTNFASGGASGQVARLEIEGNTLRFTVNGTARCGSPWTVTENAGVTRAGVVTRSSGIDPWIDYFETGALSSGTSATASGVTVSSTASLIAGGASASASATATGKTLTAAASLIYPGGTLNFQASGQEFGARTGLALTTFALENGVSYRYTVHADGLTLGAALYTSAAITLDSAGKLPNLAALSWITPGTLFRVHAIRQSDGEAATYRMRAQA